MYIHVYLRPGHSLRCYFIHTANNFLEFGFNEYRCRDFMFFYSLNSRFASHLMQMGSFIFQRVHAFDFVPVFVYPVSSLMSHVSSIRSVNGYIL